MRRFFYHYNKIQKKMSIHFKNKCIIVKDIKCYRPAETKYNKRQPYLIMRGFANNVKIKDDVGYIN